MTTFPERVRRTEGYQPNWDVDLAYGQQAELFVCDIAEALSCGQVEVKRDAQALKTGNLYVEYECRKATGHWEKSGIAVSDAQLWAFVLDDTCVTLIFPTELLRAIVRDLWKRRAPGGQHPFRAELTRGSHPTRGVLLPIEEKRGVSLKDLVRRHAGD